MVSQLIINEDIKYSMDSTQTKLNNNFAFVGAPGTYKTTLEAFNILQMNDRSHVIVDVKGSFRALKSEFERQGYEVVEFNLIDPSLSQSYNPLSYIRRKSVDTDIATIANTFIQKSMNQDPYWDNSARTLLRALIGYVYYMLPNKEFNMKSVLTLLQHCQESNGEESTLDDLFEKLRCMFTENNYAYRQYKSATCKAEKTMSCIVSVALTACNIFDGKSIQKILTDNTIQLKKIGHQKTVFIISIKDYDTSLHPIAGLLLTQLFQTLIEEANKQPDLKLSMPVQFWLDDFGSYNINDFQAIISCARSRNIGISMLFQSEGQLIQNYGIHGARTIIQCADTYLYLGGNDSETINHINERTEHIPSFIYTMKPGEVYILRRGQESQRVNLINFDHYPQYCLYNYKQEHTERRPYREYRFIPRTTLSQYTQNILHSHHYKLLPLTLDNHLRKETLVKKQETIYNVYDASHGLIFHQGIHGLSVNPNSTYPRILVTKNLRRDEIDYLFENFKFDIIYNNDKTIYFSDYVNDHDL